MPKYFSYIGTRRITSRIRCGPPPLECSSSRGTESAGGAVLLRRLKRALRTSSVPRHAGRSLPREPCSASIARRLNHHEHARALRLLLLACVVCAGARLRATGCAVTLPARMGRSSRRGMGSWRARRTIHPYGWKGAFCYFLRRLKKCILLRGWEELWTISASSLVLLLLLSLILSLSLSHTHSLSLSPSVS